MLVWAGYPGTPGKPRNVLLWQGGPLEPGDRSITEYLETRAEEVRRRYLAWSHEFGEVRVFGRPLRERFRLSGGGSFWEQSLLFEQSAWKQHSLETLLKVLAFELLLDAERPMRVVVASSDRALHRTLRGLCRQRGIEYAWMRLSAEPSATGRAWLRRLPQPVIALAALLRFAAISRKLRVRVPGGSHSRRPRVLICGPFFNYRIDADRRNEFTSSYWGPLPRTLTDGGYSLEWLHYFYSSDSASSASAVLAPLARINSNCAANGRHSFVEGYVGLWDLACVAWRSLILAAESLVVGTVLRQRFRTAPTESYWPLLRGDWARAFRGFSCVETLFFGAGFDRALRTVPKQDECLYLMENQSWERALARAWRSHGHGRLTAVAHSTLRFWDLRYHSDPRRYEADYRRRVPSPDVVALNGAMARREYLATAPARERILDCEALRYLHLQPSQGSVDRRAPRAARNRGGRLKLLVLGDYTRQRTEELLRLVASVWARLPDSIEVVVKPHPTCPVAPDDYTGFSFEVVGESVAQLATSADLVLASNTTSASLDAYVTGGRVIVHNDRGGVNYSPLRGVCEVTFVQNAADLVQAIEHHRIPTLEAPTPPESFFWIDRALPRWRNYFRLNEDSHT